MKTYLEGLTPEQRERKINPTPESLGERIVRERHECGECERLIDWANPDICVHCGGSFCSIEHVLNHQLYGCPMMEEPR